ncbi:Flp pilus assembly protein CpaB [Thermaerobacter litoralis]
MRRISWRAAASLGVALLSGATAYLIYLDATASLPVVVAARALQAPVKIEADMVSVVPLPAAAVHPGAVADPAKVVGRVLRRDVEAGEPLLEADLAPGRDAGLSLYLEGRQQAFFIPTRLEQGLGGAVEPGDRVDVIFVGGEGPGAVARTLLENLPVLQVRDEEGRRWEEGRPLGVLVGVTPDEAERLAYALTFGRVFLSLAPAAGPAGGGTGVTWDNLFLLPQGGGGTGSAGDAATGTTAGPAAAVDGPGPASGVAAAGQGASDRSDLAPPAPAGDQDASTLPFGAPATAAPDPGVPLVDPQWLGQGEDVP